MDYYFPPPPVPSSPVAGTNARFAVRRIFCVGRSYAEHAGEMRKDPECDPPFFFTNPASAVVEDGQTVAYPPETQNFPYEDELVVAIGKAGTDIPEDRALDHIFGYVISNDLTRRNLQLAAREAGRPWDRGKAFDRSAMIGPIHPVAEVGLLDHGAISLTVNGAERQHPGPCRLLPLSTGPEQPPFCDLHQPLAHDRADLQALDALPAFRDAAPMNQSNAA